MTKKKILNAVLFPQRLLVSAIAGAVLVVAAVCLTGCALLACRPSTIPMIWDSLFDL